MISLRRAKAADQATIKRIIHEADINPMSLKWPNFLLAVDDETGEVVGTGQIKPHGDGTRELASIATVPDYQRQGIAHRIIERLIAESTGVLYLTCMSNMGPFYEQFGFVTQKDNELTPYFKRISLMARAYFKLDPQKRRMLVMKREDGRATGVKRKA
jgi:N-acetylglutamate synthase-like GNAT family acetyltransferase